MKFEDILFLIETGNTVLASVNPLAGLGVEAGIRLVRLGHDAYVSGRESGEWTDAQAKHFDEVVLPTITSQPHWKKNS